jgi:hypothetical protein
MEERKEQSFIDDEGNFRMDFPKGFNLLTGYVTHSIGERNQRQDEIYKLSTQLTIK